MRSAVSVRGQTVIPRLIREALNITRDTQLEWQVKDGVILAVPIPRDPVQAAVGILKGRGPTTEDLLAERKIQREKER